MHPLLEILIVDAVSFSAKQDAIECAKALRTMLFIQLPSLPHIVAYLNLSSDLAKETMNLNLPLKKMDLEPPIYFLSRVDVDTEDFSGNGIGWVGFAGADDPTSALRLLFVLEASSAFATVNFEGDSSLDVENVIVLGAEVPPPLPHGFVDVSLDSNGSQTLEPAFPFLKAKFDSSVWTMQSAMTILGGKVVLLKLNGDVASAWWGESKYSHQRYSGDSDRISFLSFMPETETLDDFFRRARPSDPSLGRVAAWIHVNSREEYYDKEARVAR